MPPARLLKQRSWYFVCVWYEITLCIWRNFLNAWRIRANLWVHRTVCQIVLAFLCSRQRGGWWCWWDRRARSKSDVAFDIGLSRWLLTSHTIDTFAALKVGETTNALQTSQVAIYFCASMRVIQLTRRHRIKQSLKSNQSSCASSLPQYNRVFWGGYSLFSCMVLLRLEQKNIFWMNETIWNRAFLGR